MFNITLTEALITQNKNLKEELERARKFIKDMAVHPSCPKCGTQRLLCEYGHTWDIN